ncbi:MAG: 2-oxoacid:acceptor oxidoreductase family protein [Chloroflexi bacterium]|nr:2-oxoacid:acceptor oxidoreductase family protein [Chloroflexota bacterium]
MAERHEIRLCGFGGQGVILAGHIIGQAAAIYEHKHATFIQDYGPEARGGSTRADVVVSDERVTYPYIETPTVLLAMSQPAYDKYHPQNHRDALVIIDAELVKPIVEAGKKVISVPARRIAEELGRTAVANSVMLGFFTAATGIVSPDAIKKAIAASVPKNTIELNLKAFDRGYAYGLEHSEAR